MEKIEGHTHKAWYLYMIECQDNSIYTGIAVNVAARYALHVSGKGARYTRAHPPKKLIVVIEYQDHSSALKAEYAMKNKTAEDKRKFAAAFKKNKFTQISTVP